MLSFIHILSTRVDLYFSVHNLSGFSSNTGKVHFEALVNVLIYISNNKNLGLKNSNIEDAPLSDPLIQASINNENRVAKPVSSPRVV